jgi:hypothetical protein
LLLLLPLPAAAAAAVADLAFELQLDQPQYPLTEVVVVMDRHTGPFLRQLANLPGHSSSSGGRSSSSGGRSSAGGRDSDNSTPADGGCSPGGWMLQQLLSRLKVLQALGWVDRVVLADPEGKSAIKVSLCRCIAKTKPTLGGGLISEND